VLGLVAEARGRREDALRRFELAARFDPRDAEFQAALERARAGADDPAR
jgi:hypothetical protein